MPIVVAYFSPYSVNDDIWSMKLPLILQISSIDHTKMDELMNVCTYIAVRTIQNREFAHLFAQLLPLVFLVFWTPYKSPHNIQQN